MSVRTPRKLKQHRAELALERQQLVARLAVIDREVAALDYALKLLDPEWKAPKKVAVPFKRGPLPRGAVAAWCLRLLRQYGELWTPEVVRHIVDANRLRFDSRRASEDFASSVAMALRRYERAGAVEEVGLDPRNQARRWRLRRDAEGRIITFAKAVA